MPPKKDEPLRQGVGKVLKPAKKPRAKKRPTTDFDKQPDDLMKWKNDALKDRCRFYGIPVSGNKAALVQRIQDHVAAQAADNEDAEEGEEVNEHDGAEDGEPGSPPKGAEHKSTSPNDEDPGQSVGSKKSPGLRQGPGGAATEGKPLDWVEWQKRMWKKEGVGEPAGSDGEPERDDNEATESLKENRKSTGGKKPPVNGFRTPSQGGKGLPGEEPCHTATQREIKRAREYRDAIFDLVQQVREDGDERETIFNELVHHLAEAKKLIKGIMDAEVIVESEEEPEDPVEDQNVYPAAAGTQSRKRASSSPENQQEPASKRIRSSSSSSSSSSSGSRSSGGDKG